MLFHHNRKNMFFKYLSFYKITSFVKKKKTFFLRLFMMIKFFKSFILYYFLEPGGGKHGEEA